MIDRIRWFWLPLLVGGCAIAAGDGVCLQASLPRGATLSSGACPAGTSRLGLMCAAPCPGGTSEAGSVCLPACPSGFADEGTRCRKPGPMTSAAYGWLTGDAPFDFDTGPRARCEARQGKGQCYRSGNLWYPQCPAGFRKAGDLVCVPECVAPLVDEGAVCRKAPVARALSQPACPVGTTWFEGRCAADCPAGWPPSGARCAAACPAEMPVSCGAFCGRDARSCTGLPAEPSAAGALLGFLAGHPAVSSPAKAALAGASAVAPGVVARANAPEAAPPVRQKAAAWWAAIPPLHADSLWARAAIELAQAKAEGLFDLELALLVDRAGITQAIVAADTIAVCPAAPAPPRPVACPGGLAFAGACYRVDDGFALDSLTTQAAICPPGFRGAGGSCWPAWTGAAESVAVNYPTLVVDCAKPTCPPNFVRTGACGCAASVRPREIRPVTALR